MAESRPDHESGRIQALSDWIIEQGLAAEDLATLMDEVCRRMVALDLPLWRVHVSMATLHPTFSAFGGSWLRDQGFVTEHYERADTPLDRWQKSPLRVIVEGNLTRLRRRLRGAGAQVDFPILEELKAAGATDWFARAVRFGRSRQDADLQGLITTWATDRSGGFSDADLEVIERVAPRIALCGYRIALQVLVRNLLGAYLGADAGRRVLDGQIERGAATRVTAVLLLADLRGFTKTADETPGEILLARVNDYLGNLTDVVEAHGGQVLKFLGDGLLATFALEGRPAAEVCARALAAARAGLDGNTALNQGRQRVGYPALSLDIALHLGEVMYGNVGSERRLDFTVIGPAVNEAARIEAMCEPLGHHLLISESFAGACGQTLDSVGSHALRGVARPQELFTA